MAKQILHPSVRRKKIIRLKKQETNHKIISKSRKERTKIINQRHGAQTSSSDDHESQGFPNACAGKVIVKSVI